MGFLHVFQIVQMVPTVLIVFNHAKNKKEGKGEMFEFWKVKQCKKRNEFFYL